MKKLFFLIPLFIIGCSGSDWSDWEVVSPGSKIRYILKATNGDTSFIFEHKELKEFSILKNLFGKDLTFSSWYGDGGAISTPKLIFINEKNDSLIFENNFRLISRYHATIAGVEQPIEEHYDYYFSNIETVELSEFVRNTNSLRLYIIGGKKIRIERYPIQSIKELLNFFKDL